MPEDAILRQKLTAAMDEETMQHAQTVSKEFAKLIVYYKCAMLEVQTRFTVLNEEFALEHGRTPVNSIKTRLKTIPSIREKMERRSIPFSLEAMEEAKVTVDGTVVEADEAHRRAAQQGDEQRQDNQHRAALLTREARRPGSAARSAHRGTGRSLRSASPAPAGG